MLGYKTQKNIPNLVLWWDASDPTTINDGLAFQYQNVYKFVDKKSGVVLRNFSGANGPTYSYGVINGKNAIHFPYYSDSIGNLKSLVNSNINLPNLDLDVKTIFFVFKPTTTTSTNKKYALSIWTEGQAVGSLTEPPVSIRSGSGNNPYTEYSEGSQDIEGERNLFFRNEKSYQYGLKTSTNVDRNTLQIMIARTRNDSGVSKFISLQENGFDSKLEYYNNGDLILSQNLSSLAQPPFALSIGSFFYQSLNKTTDQHPLEGYFCEMLYYNRFLEDHEVNTIGTHLLRKWDPLRFTFSVSSIPIPRVPVGGGGGDPGGGGGDPEPPTYTAPSVTLDVTSYTSENFSMGNIIIEVTLGTLQITGRGLMFSSTINPPSTRGYERNDPTTDPFDLAPETKDIGSLSNLDFATTYFVRGYVEDANGTYYSPVEELSTSSVLLELRSGSNTTTNPVDFQYNDNSNQYITYWDARIANLTANTEYNCGILGDTNSSFDLDTAEFKLQILQTSDSNGRIINPSGKNFWQLDLDLIFNANQLSQFEGRFIYFKSFVVDGGVTRYSPLLLAYFPVIKFESLANEVNNLVLTSEALSPEFNGNPPLDPTLKGFRVNNTQQDPYFNTSTNLTGTFVTNENRFTATSASSLAGTSIRAYLEIQNRRYWSSKVDVAAAPSDPLSITFADSAILNLVVDIVQNKIWFTIRATSLAGNPTKIGAVWRAGSSAPAPTITDPQSKKRDYTITGTPTQYAVGVSIPVTSTSDIVFDQYYRLRLYAENSIGTTIYASPEVYFYTHKFRINSVSENKGKIIVNYLINNNINVQAVEIQYSTTPFYTESTINDYEIQNPNPISSVFVFTPTTGVTSEINTTLAYVTGSYIRMKLRPSTSSINDNTTLYSNQIQLT